MFANISIAQSDEKVLKDRVIKCYPCPHFEPCFNMHSVDNIMCFYFEHTDFHLAQVSNRGVTDTCEPWVHRTSDNLLEFESCYYCSYTRTRLYKVNIVSVVVVVDGI